jgi:2-haloacid dehalogenase
MNDNHHKTPVMIFDFGGVLLDWNPFYLYRKMLGEDRRLTDQFLKDVNFSEWNLEQDRGRSFVEGTAELCARFPQYCELIHAYDERFPETLGGVIQPVVDVLYSLKSAGYPLYGLSNWSAEKFHLVRPRFPFFECFDEMVISGEVGLVKPEPAIYELLLERIGRPANECLFIDDNSSNILTADQLGIQTIQFRSPAQLHSELINRGILNNAG